MSRAAVRPRNPWLSRATVKALAVILAYTQIGPIRPAVVVAQEQGYNCSVTGFCISNSTTDLLGLPHGSLNIVSYLPWGRVVKSPDVPAWEPIEADARAAVAGLHGVANDDRLPYAAIDEIRAVMFTRLLAIAKKKNLNQPLSGVEQNALDAFVFVINKNREGSAQKALAEYDRWEIDKCHYTVPSGFGFEQYDPGPNCSVGTVVLIPPRPPTMQQFSAYGTALQWREDHEVISNRKRAALGVSESDPTFNYDVSADFEASQRTFDQGLAVSLGVAGAAVATAFFGVLAASSTAVATTFAAMAGSMSVFGVASGGTIGATVFASAAGLGTALGLPAIIILSIVGVVVASVQFMEDQSVKPALEQALTNSRTIPDIWSTAQQDDGKLAVFTAFLNQTLPSFDEQRAESVVQPPNQPGPGDPKFKVGTEERSVIETWTKDGRVQQTFMSQGWFVIRTLIPNTLQEWTPWRWSLTLTYLRSNTETGIHHAGIFPYGFYNVDEDANGVASPAERVPSLLILNQALQQETVSWFGNQPPTLRPRASDKPELGAPVTFTANASDADQGDSVVAIKWFVQDPAWAPANPDFAECTFTPSGRTSPTNGLPYLCPWMAVNDSGAGFQYVYGRAGTWGVLVIAKDELGAVAREQFTVKIANVPPTLTVQAPPAHVNEGQPLNVTGTVGFPSLPDGTFSALTKVVVEWGDGTATEREFPCSLSGFGSDYQCNQTCSGAGSACVYVPVSSIPAGPWPFTFSRTYTYALDDPMPHPAVIMVHAQTNLDGRIDAKPFNVSVDNVVPTLEASPACGPPTQFGNICIGFDQRTVAFGNALSIRARIIDAPNAQHSVNVLWGDGTSDFLPPGCAASGCPGTVEPWPGATTPAGTTPKYLKVTHSYTQPGNYSVKLLVNDGGPSGLVSGDAPAVIYGLSSLSAPTTEVRAGAPAYFTYAGNLPTALMTSLVPTCEAGTVVELSSDRFACEFDDVSAKTARQVKLRAVLAGTAFEKTVSVDVLQRATSLSPLSGPTTVMEGSTVTYTYRETHAPGPVLYGGSCGSAGTLLGAGSTGVTCKFHDVSATTATAVSVTVFAGGGEGSAGLTVDVVPDTTAPVLTLPSNIQANSTSHAGAAVSFSASAEDEISGPATVTCSPDSGSTFPIGSTSVSCSASDWQGNLASGGFSVVVADKTPPSLTLPAPLDLNATSPAGAVATFTATAADTSPAAPSVTCSPASGSTFAIGTTGVTCSATDAAGNTGSGSFQVTVRGALDQLTALRQYVAGQSIDASLKSTLLSSLDRASSAVRNNRADRCSQLDVVAVQARTASRLTPAQRSRILTDIARIKAVIGC